MLITVSFAHFASIKHRNLTEHEPQAVLWNVGIGGKTSPSSEHCPSFQAWLTVTKALEWYTADRERRTSIFDSLYINCSFLLQKRSGAESWRVYLMFFFSYFYYSHEDSCHVEKQVHWLVYKHIWGHSSWAKVLPCKKHNIRRNISLFSYCCFSAEAWNSAGNLKCADSESCCLCAFYTFSKHL